MAKRRKKALTQLEKFIRARRIKPAHLARESGYSRQHLLQLRYGKREPTRPCIAAVVGALRRLSGVQLSAQDLWNLGDRP